MVLSPAGAAGAASVAVLAGQIATRTCDHDRPLSCHAWPSPCSRSRVTGKLARLGLDAQAIPTARRVLIVHTIGSAAFAAGPPAPGTGDASDPSSPIGAAESRRRFHTSLGWLLAGIAHDGHQGSRP